MRTSNCQAQSGCECQKIATLKTISVAVRRNCSGRARDAAHARVRALLIMREAMRLVSAIVTSRAFGVRRRSAASTHWLILRALSAVAAPKRGLLQRAKGGLA